MTSPAPEPADDIERLRILGERRPSIGDDGNVVLAADRYGALPPWATPFHLVSLIAHGYVEHVTGFDRAVDQQSSYVLTESGRELREQWAEIRGHTARAARPYGLLTPPSPGEVRDNADRDGPSLHWPQQRPY